MKFCGSEAQSGVSAMDILIVDGYNIIGAWPELKEMKDTDLEGARDLLIDKMAEYQAYTGYEVIIVFDAYLVPGIQKVFNRHDVTVIFTSEGETADEKIEQLTVELKGVLTQIHVATSDYAEQKAIFGQGALRKSARELLNEVKRIEKGIEEKIEEIDRGARKSKIWLSPEVQAAFEKWRRGES